MLYLTTVSLHSKHSFLKQKHSSKSNVKKSCGHHPSPPKLEKPSKLSTQFKLSIEFGRKGATPFLTRPYRPPAFCTPQGIPQCSFEFSRTSIVENYWSMRETRGQRGQAVVGAKHCGVESSSAWRSRKGARWDPSWAASGVLLRWSLTYGRKEGLGLALSRKDGGGRWPKPCREQVSTPWLRLGRKEA